MSHQLTGQKLMNPNIIAICIMNQNSKELVFRRVEDLAEYEEMGEGHVAIHTHLPSGQRKRVSLYRLEKTCGQPKAAHRRYREILKHNAEEAVDQPYRKDTVGK